MPFVVVRSARGAELVGMIISENEQRRPDTAMNRAEKAARMIDRGASHEDAAIALGLETGQVKNLLALLGAPKFVRHAVEAEKVTLSNGIKAAKLAEKEGPDAGRKLIEKLIEHAPRTPGKKRSSNSRKARGIVDGAPVMRGKKEVAELRDMLARAGGNPLAAAWVEALEWVLGERDKGLADNGRCGAPRQSRARGKRRGGCARSESARWASSSAIGTVGRTARCGRSARSTRIRHTMGFRSERGRR